MSRWLNSLQPWGVLLLRLVLGVAMVSASHEKVFTQAAFHSGHYLVPMQHFNQFVVSLGLPAWLGYLSTITEFFGGLAILIGLFTRFWAFMIAGNMIVAIVTVNRHHGYAGSQYSIALVAIAAMILLTGPGALALDRKLGLH